MTSPMGRTGKTVGSRLAAGAALVLVAATAVACSGTGDDSAATAAAAAGSVQVDLTLKSAELVRDDAPRADLDADVGDEVLAALQTYVETATVGPLTTGEPADLSSLLTSEAATATDDADALVEPAGTTVRSLVARTADVSLLGLGSGDDLDLVVAELDLHVRGRGGSGTIEVQRTGQVTLVPEDGGWRIAGYDLAVERSGDEPAEERS
jgi:hypothetical protein